MIFMLLKTAGGAFRLAGAVPPSSTGDDDLRELALDGLRHAAAELEAVGEKPALTDVVEIYTPDGAVRGIALGALGLSQSILPPPSGRWTVAELVPASGAAPALPRGR